MRTAADETQLAWELIIQLRAQCTSRATMINEHDGIIRVC